MAELIVSPLLEAVIDKLGSGLWKELRLLRGVKKDILKLQSTLSTIKDVLEDAEQRSISDKPLCSWLKKLKDAAYDADDVMDEIQTEALRRRMENDGHPLKGQSLKLLKKKWKRRPAGLYTTCLTKCNQPPIPSNLSHLTSPVSVPHLVHGDCTPTGQLNLMEAKESLQRLKIYRRRRRRRQVGREKEDFRGMTTAWQQPG